MRDKLQPCEAESWIERWAQINEKVWHTEQNQLLSFLVEAIRMVHSCQNVHEHSVVRSLIEISFIDSVILIKNFSDELKDLCHELMLVELEHFQEHNDKLHESINVSEI